MIGLSTSYYAAKGLSVYDSVSETVNLGFNLVELGAAHGFEDDIWDTLYKIKRDFPEIIFTIHTLFPPLERKTWFNPADGLNWINKKVIDSLFKSALILESSVVSIHPPVLSDVTLSGKKAECNFERPELGGSKDEAASKRNFIELMRYAIKETENTGIRLLIENMDISFMNTFPSSKESFSEFFHTFPETGLLLDVGHALQSGNLYELSELEQDIFELHLHDAGNSPERGRWFHLPIKDVSYFEPLKGIMGKESVFFVFEHGADVCEEDILREKKLFQEFVVN